MLVVLFIGCAGSGEEKQETTETESIKMPSPRAKLAPGTAKVEAKILDMKKENNYYICIIKVEKVLSYGMSTRPIGKGSEISLHILSNEEDFINMLSEGTLGQKYEFSLEQELKLNMSDNQMGWKAIKVKETSFEE
jgi:hypothetical protein